MSSIWDKMAPVDGQTVTKISRRSRYSAIFHQHSVANNSSRVCRKVAAILSHIFKVHTNLFLTLIPVKRLGKISVKLVEV